MAVLEEQVSEFSVRHYSNRNLKLRQIETGIIYDDAIDIIPCQFTYEETDIPIESENLELESEEALRIITGEVFY